VEYIHGYRDARGRAVHRQASVLDYFSLGYPEALEKLPQKVSELLRSPAASANMAA
jgi:hypothetical protein